MREQILEQFKIIQQKYNIKILFACETGSRAWGIPSFDSDFDIRFIYIHDPAWYLTIFKRDDSINIPKEGILDFHGWDIRKSLKMVAWSNAAIFEWINSSIVYMNNYDFQFNIKLLIDEYFSSERCIYHYIKITEKIYNEIKEARYFSLKKFFYIIKYLLSAIWISENDELPPIEFDKLLNIIDDETEVLDIIAELKMKKIYSDKKEKIKPINCLNDFFEAEIERCKLRISDYLDKDIDTDKLDDFFIKLLKRID